MRDKGSAKHLFIFISTGFLTGLLFTILVFLALAEAEKTDFAWVNLSVILRESPLTVIFLLLPFLFALVSFRVYMWIDRVKMDSGRQLEKELRIRQEALHLSRNLLGSDLSETSFSEKDELLDTLDSLRKNLVESEAHGVKLKEEQAKRQWSSEGLTLFSDILRNQSEDMKTMAYSLIRNMVVHLDANQGGFFLTESDQEGKRYFAMLSAYAYGRDKFADKRIPYDEGLLGMCALEKEMIYMTEVPQGYLEITSGLGKANPECIVILPLLDQDEVKGMIELASFREFEEHQLEFLKTLAENIAISLTNIQNTYRTRQLLEETRKQAEVLSLKDEQMRRNMEELRSTQEKAAMQAEEFISFSNTVNHTLIRAEYDTQGTLIYANTKFLRKLGYSGNREVEGKSILMFIHEKDREWFNRIWESLAIGGKHFEGYMKHITRKGQDLWTMATYTCVRREDGSVDKILFLAIDTTEQKKQSLDYEGQIEAIDRLVLKSEFAPDGRILQVNNRFSETLNPGKDNGENNSLFDYLNPRDLETITELWERIISGKPHRGQIRLLTRDKQEKWFMASFSAVSDMYGEVYKVIFLANEITHEKTLESESQKQMEDLKKKAENTRMEILDLKEKLRKEKDIFSSEKNELIWKVSIYKHLLNSMDSLILISDNEGIVQFINQSGLRFFGMKSLQVLEKPLPALYENFTSPDDRKMLSSLINYTSQEKKESTIRIRDLNGENTEFRFTKDSAERDQRVFHIFSLAPIL